MLGAFFLQNYLAVWVIIVTSILSYCIGRRGNSLFDAIMGLLCGNVIRKVHSAIKGKGECKMFLCVRTDLGMGKGKIAAQCCHAAIEAFRIASSQRKNYLNEWYNGGQAKVVLKVQDEAELQSLYREAKKMGLPAWYARRSHNFFAKILILVCSIISDAGKTQIPAASKTVAAIGPGPKDVVDVITGHLKLL